MDKKKVKDLMLSLDEYPVVSMDATLLDAVNALKKAQENLSPGQPPHRAVLVIDPHSKIVGKIGQLAFLKGLEPDFEWQNDLQRLADAGVSDREIDTLMQNIRFWQDNFTEICHRAIHRKVKDVMLPFKKASRKTHPYWKRFTRLSSCRHYLFSLLENRK